MKVTTINPHVTRWPWWPPSHGGPIYGTTETYARAAVWLKDCPTVDDWGGGFGAFGNFLPATTRYRVVDGTEQITEMVLADVMRFDQPSDGILIRHVLEHVEDWAQVLDHAVTAMRQRLVLITYTEPAIDTHVDRFKSHWPVWAFNPADLRHALRSALVSDEAVFTSHPEHLYYCERRS